MRRGLFKPAGRALRGALLLLAGGLGWGADSAAELRATALAELPADRAGFGAAFVARQALPAVRLTMARGEGELFAIALSGARGAVHAELLGAAAGFELELYRLAWTRTVTTDAVAPQLLSKPDQMIPLPTGRPWRCADDPCLLLARLSARRQAPAGERRLRLRLRSVEQDPGAEVSLVVWCAPLQLASAPALTVQGSLGGRGGRWDEPRILRLFTFLSDYGINAAAPNPGLVRWPGRFYPQLLALPGIGRARLLYVNAGSYFTRHEFNAANRARFLRRMQIQVETKTALAKRYPGAFHAMLWDEPHGPYVEQAGQLYRRLAEIKPAELLSEVTVAAEKLSAVAQMADILTLGLLQASPAEIREQQLRGKEVWLYANRMHSLEQPYPTMRNVGWLLWRLRLDGYLFWDTALWEADPRGGRYGFDSRYGRGMFVYPGADEQSFYPSLRLAMFREGLEDYRLLRQLSVSVDDPEINRALGFQPGKRVYAHDPSALHDRLLRRLD